jgi:hypothetical protein
LFLASIARRLVFVSVTENEKAFVSLFHSRVHFLPFVIEILKFQKATWKLATGVPIVTSYIRITNCKNSFSFELLLALGPWPPIYSVLLSKTLEYEYEE